MTKDDLVGETIYFLDEIKLKGRLEEQVQIAYKGKSAGTVTVVFDFISNASNGLHLTH